MPSLDTPRLIGALILLGIGAGTAMLFDGPAPAIACALVGGFGAALLLAWHQPAHVVEPTTAVVDAPDDAEPGLAAMIEAIDDPVLVIDGSRVSMANEAAKALLGRFIVDEDVRLAIRHPAATERLIGRAEPSDQPSKPEVIELVGLGERDKRWEMIAYRLSPKLQFVRLADRTRTYVAERSRVDFVANASHELRTPLATLLGFIETLEDRNAAEDAATRARFLKIMFGEAKRMQQLVDDLMSLSRIEAERYSSPRGAVTLPALIEEVRGSITASQRLDPDRIVLRLGEALPPVAGDRVQISQLLFNLIGNALKYGRAGAPVRVTIDMTGTGMIRLAIADEGEGVAPEHLPRLTERFYRVDPSRSRQMGGTGLGLAIVKHVVERHRGRLDISSVVGRGTTVTVLLPAAVATENAA